MPNPRMTQEEPLVDVPPAEAMMDLEGMPQLEDGGSEESREEYLVDVPLIEEPLAQPWVRFEAQILQDEVQHWAAMFTWFQAMHLCWWGESKEER